MGEGGASGTIVDLFCGCGGFSLGAELAGFRSIAAVDVDPVLQSGFRRNFPRTRALQADISDITASDWQLVLDGERPDGVIGGPPCQGFSWIGKRKRDDPRNTLIAHFFRQVTILKPRFFVMENVEGILHHATAGLFDAALELIPSHYAVLRPLVVNASEFGAATKRKRMVLLGVDTNEMQTIAEWEVGPAPGISKINVREAISDLPSPVLAGNLKGDLGWARYPTIGEPLSRYAQVARSGAPPGLGSIDARSVRRAGFVSGLHATKHSPEISRRYSEIGGGRSDPITKSYKLEWEGQCPTLRAGTGSDRGAFQAVRPLHPSEGRVICVREAARLQGFPDWFEFHATKWHSFRMIGNSVSPIVSKGIMELLGKKMHLQLAA